MLKKIIILLLKLKVISWKKNIMIKIYDDRKYEVIYKINEKGKRKRKRKNKKIRNYIRIFLFCNLKEFNITVKLLNIIAILANIGVIEIPKGLNMPIARGIIRAL